MYALTKYNEVNFEFIFKSTLCRISLLKSKRNIIKPKLNFIIIFKNVIEPDFTKVYLHILMLWVMTGKLCNVKKIGHSLRRGIRYYRFILRLNVLDNFRFYRFLEFLSYSLFDYISTRNYYYVEKKKYNTFFLIKNINGFTNLRFSDNFYLSGMDSDLIVNFVKPEIGNYFDYPTFFLSLFKLV